MTTERARVEELLPRYDVRAEIGRGAFGVVWSAVHRDLRRPVAVKMLLPRLAEDRQVRARFITEGRVVATLDHPHVVPVHDYLEQDGLCLLVMDQLMGGSVSGRLREGAVSPEWACAVALATAAGLHHAHTRGVLHRDVKPENLLMTDDGIIKVTDFGIARVVAGNETRITEAASILGTPAYMAPEQAEGMELGPQADVYALGVVLYELLSGELPFPTEGGAWAVLLRRLTADPRPLREVAHDAPPALEDVVMTALARSPADRFASAEAFGVALGDAATASWGPGWLERAGAPLLGGGPIAESIRPTTDPPAPAIHSGWRGSASSTVVPAHVSELTSAAPSAGVDGREPPALTASSDKRSSGTNVPVPLALALSCVGVLVVLGEGFSTGHWVTTAPSMVALLTAVLSLVSVVWVRHRRRDDFGDIADLALPNRSELIKRVWNQRIRNALDPSIDLGAEMKLNLTLAPELLQLSYQQLAGDTSQPMDVVTAYEESGNQLLILGSPGAGKTTLALTLMRHLLEVARQHQSAPIPELFSLARWTPSQGRLIDWLAEELQLRHGYPQSVGRSALYHHKVMAVLDGFDEVDPNHRRACLAAVNDYWKTHRGGPIVLCSRPEEYEEIGQLLLFGGAVRVQPPTRDEIGRYLLSAGPQWAPVVAALAQDEDPLLAELLSSPLLVSVAVHAYRAGDVRELSSAIGPDRRQALWDRYVDVMHGSTSELMGTSARQVRPYDMQEVRRWLGWLARRTRDTNDTEFWLHEHVGSRPFRFVVRLLIAAAMALLSSAVLAVTAVPDAALSESLVAGVVFGIAGGVFATVRPAYRAPVRLRTALRGIAVAVGGGVSAGLVLASSLIAAMSYLSEDVSLPSASQLVVTGLAVGAVLGLGFCPAMTVIAIGPGRTRIVPRSPTQILTGSAVAGLLGASGVGVVILLALTLLVHRGMVEAAGVAVAAGLVASLVLGVGAGVFHLAYRLLLALRGDAPLRWVAFLDWACQHLYLRSTGAAYQWIHFELRDHLAATGMKSSEPFNPAHPTEVAGDRPVLPKTPGS